MGDTIILNNAIINARGKFTLGQAPPTPQPYLYLFVNDQFPSCSDTLADYTICSLAGYADVQLVPANWTFTQDTCAGVWAYPVVTFNLTGGGQTIYGHLVYDEANEELMWVDLWATPFLVPGGGGTVQVALQWTDHQC